MRWAGLTAVAAVAAGAGAAGAREPAVQVSYFAEPLTKMLYFKNPRAVVGLDRAGGRVFCSSDHGARWAAAAGIPAGRAAQLYAHPFEAQTAFVLSGGTEHWVTRDEGRTWEAFSTPLPPTSGGERPLSFHAARPGWVLFVGERCHEETSGWWPFPRLVCRDEPYYVRDGFHQAARDHAAGDTAGAAVAPLLGEGRAVAKCLWARHTREFDAMAEEAIFCLEIVDAGRTLAGREAQAPRTLAARSNEPRGLLDELFGAIGTATTMRLVVSEDFFKTERVVAFGSGNDGHGGDRAGGGVVAMSVVRGFALAAISHARSDEMDLFVSVDGHTWAESRLPLPPGALEDAYTVLESSRQSVLVDVQSSTGGVAGALFRSNSNGTYYRLALEHTHRSRDGLVDVERVHGVDGVLIANQVTNWDRAGAARHPELRSRVSFDDGARWRFLAPPDRDPAGRRYGCSADGRETGACALHVHSVTALRTPGRVFGAAGAPGVVLAVGSVGGQLAPHADCDTFLSRDGAQSWAAARKGPHHAQLADSGAAIVLAPSAEPADAVTYSLDGGRTWQAVALGVRMRISALVADDDGLSPVALAVGTVQGGGGSGSHGGEQAVAAIDFGRAWDRQCRLDPADPQPGEDTEAFVVGGAADCVMGHRSDYVRRKPGAQCAMRLDRVLVSRQRDCECTERDFECDYNFAPDAAGRCEPAGPAPVPRGECQGGARRYLGSSGYRLIPGNTCVRRAGSKAAALDAPVDRPCPEPQTQPPPGQGAGGSPTHHSTTVRGEPHVVAFPNSTAYLMLTTERELRRTGDGGAGGWARVELPRGAGAPVFLAENRYHAHRAYAYTDAGWLLATDDRGASWRRLAGLPARANALHVRPLMDFNAANPDWLLFVGGTPCPRCHTEIYVSSDAGAKWTRLATHATQCRFARTADFDALPAEAVVCAVLRDSRGREQDEQQQQPGPNRSEVRVFRDPFRSTKYDVIAIPDAGRSDLLGFQIHGRFMVFAVVQSVAADTGGAEPALKLFVSDDGRAMHEARFPPSVSIRPEGYTLLPAHAGTLLVDVEGAPNTGDPDWGSGWGTLFASNSNGTHFHRVLQHTNRNRHGLVDVERVEGLDGMLIANRVANADALGQRGVHKLLRTVASWDDGRSWHPLPAPPAEPADPECAGCSLNLYSRAAMVSVGRLYSAPTAPGQLMGVGSVGTHLGRYTEAHTFLSRDGGVSWRRVAAGETQYEFADHGSVLVLLDDAGPTDSLRYSVDGGRSWSAYRFSDAKIIVDRITNGLTSGGQSVLIVGRAVRDGGVNLDEAQVTTVDFSRLHTRQCVLDVRDHERSDFELWTPRWGPRDAICVLGAETSYWRRKPTAACYVGDEFRPEQTRERLCECSLRDYECDEGFWLDDAGRCALDGPDPAQPPDCRDGTAYMGSSGYRKNPRSRCTPGASDDLARPVERICGRAGGTRATAHVLDAPVAEVQYFENSVHVIARTTSGRAYVSMDEGARWAPLGRADGSDGSDGPQVFSAVLRHPHFEDHAYLLPRTGSVALYTDDEARTTRTLRLPAVPAHAYGPALRFHPEYPDWLIFLGQAREGCTRVDAADCRVQAFVTQSHGARWDPLLAPVGPGGCAFLHTPGSRRVHRAATACMRATPRGTGDVVSSDNWFRSETLLLTNATDFALVGGFLLMSQDADAGRALTMHVSADGHAAAVAQFPGDKRTLDPAYTVMEPSEGFEYHDLSGIKQKMPSSGLTIHVTKNRAPSQEWGTLYTSNSNGTYYRRALEFVNRDEAGLVDFERVRGLEGVVLANVVANAQGVFRGQPKQLRTMVTMDGGSRWHYLRVADDSASHCRQTAPRSGECALHLHGYTEVLDPVNIYSAPGAIGMAMGVGNVGSHLGRLGDADTFLSADGGNTWVRAHKGPKWHKFGDHGALIVVADRVHPAAAVDYSMDRGRTWHSLALPDAARPMRVDLLTTTPDATSRRFLLYGERAGKGVVVGIDLSGAQPRMCVFDPRGPKTGGDFELFAPAEGECLLGRKAQYYRRTAAAPCYVGGEFSPVHFISSRCECTERDYECNHNFVREYSGSDDTVGRCVLVQGMQAPRTNCTKGQRDYFTIEAAYRRIPQSICQRGLVLDAPTEVWCPGRARIVALLWTLVILAAFLALAYLAYRRWRDGHSYIRLEDIGSVVRPAIHNLRPRPGSSGVLSQLETVFDGAIATARAAGGAARESLLWALDRAAPYLPHPIQRWSYDHPPRWGAARAMDGRSRRAIRADDGSRFSYHPLAANEAAHRVFGPDPPPAAADEYDELEAQFNHLLEDDDGHVDDPTGESDASFVDRQVLFANTELSDADSEH
ncbi:vacuolar protein sorting/targeting protein PEP1 [Coemansia javaensis]|uniref:Vacuolar protein sorting/targeting protein PEP1 n=1 Tax=Coemansia javaensis TaxID=2761396 RepID=A0A9W8H6W7_9FUNG|nr:vacuolar protein sorting/targeting protein PEP1 [Coemansia javaensis]